MPSYVDLNTNQLAVTATAQRITETHDDVGGVIVKALSTNTISVYVGDSGVSTSNGYELAPGEFVVLGINDPAQVYVRASTTGATVCWAALSPSSA